jgi:glyoxalase family protein
MPNLTIPGFHHVTAIAGDPQRNLDFYSGLLGLRLVKRTVNFDAPRTYHLYYGDETGQPGSLLTFFPWRRATKGRHGTGQGSAVAFSIPQEAIGYWVERLKQNGVAYDGPKVRFDEEVLSFQDPDGLELELVTDAQAESFNPWEKGSIPAKYAIRRLFGLTLDEQEAGRTVSFLTGTLGFQPSVESNGRARYVVGEAASKAHLDLRLLPEAPVGFVAVGCIHHIAWRTPNEQEQRAWREMILQRGFKVTLVIDRHYFHSIYFREPGGVLFEIATDPPGFLIDETRESLGGALKLPPWLENDRLQLEKRLPPLQLPYQQEPK